MVKLTQSKIDEVIINVAGKEGLRLVKKLKGKENISEFVLATKLKRDIKIVRNLLYKLYNHNLISSTRKKDKQKGWYIYYWTLIPENIKFLYLKNKKIELIKLKEQLKKEQTEQFYTCSKKCVRLDFDQAIDFEFRCPECGELISQYQDPKKMIELEKKINNLEKELKSEEKVRKIVKKKVIKEKIVKKKPVKKPKKVSKKSKKKSKKKALKKKAVKKKTIKKKLTKKIKKKTKSISQKSKKTIKKKLIKKKLKKR